MTYLYSIGMNEQFTASAVLNTKHARDHYVLTGQSLTTH